MLMLKRKNLVLGMLVVLLVITGYLNFVYNQNALGDKKVDKPQSSKGIQPKVVVKDSDKNTGENILADSEENTPEVVGASSSGGFFVEYRFERENTRKKEIEYIREIVDNPKTEVDTKNEAQGKLLEITAKMEKELNIEGLLKAKGFEDSIVIFNQDYISVIVGQDELETEEVAQILDIVKRESGKSAENIKIIPTGQ
ncbi:MAG: SpoIIIAH-like family protein [Clostridiales bacterium]|nr:SpoIIIAH-like family protein [Clostridiales bacterium]